MIVLTLLLTLAADPADTAPHMRIVDAAPVVPVVVKPAVDEDEGRGAVVAVSALGGAVGFGTMATAGIVVGTGASLATGGAAAGPILLLTIAALPIGSGLGAMVGHSLASSDGAVGAGIAGVAGTIGGAVVGGGLGVAMGVGIASANGTTDYSAYALGGIVVGALGAGVGALIGSAVGPAIHAAVE